MSPATFRFAGALAALGPADRDALLRREAAGDPDVRRDTAAIIGRVRRDGDDALRALALEFDGVGLDEIEVPPAACRAALEALPAPLRRAMERAATNLAAVHGADLPRAVEVETEPGVVVGRRPDPLARVGVYAPGGRAAYPSSVLMGVVPARAAGVGEVIVCSPPGPGGRPADAVLAAAALGGADRVFAAGGAGAIAAMAYGTATVPRVDRIVGPGNAWVTEAKLQVVGAVAIDSPAGPSELLVIADDTAPADVVAREILAQAEHDPRAVVVVLALGAGTADAIAAAVAAALPSAPRRAVIEESLRRGGALLAAESVSAAVAFGNEFAPEHLMLAMADPDAALPAVRNAGTVFLGASSSVAFGDYMSGGNHVLPTGGAARAFSGLSALDFVRWTTCQRIEPAAAARLAADVAAFACAEGLPGHAAAAAAWDSATASVADPARWSDTSRPSDPPPTNPARTAPLPRPAFREIGLYTPAAGDCEVDLSDNTSRWGTPPAAAAALSGASAASWARYPAVQATPLRQALAEYLDVAPECVTTGCGSDDVLDSAFRAFGRDGDRLAFADPSFGMVPVFGRMNGLVPVPVPLTAGYDLDPDAVLATGARIIYLCSPNSPTGTLLARATIERIVARAPGLVILDEAYAEFAGTSAVDLVRRSPRLLVVRTLSKAFGLAGLRIGYAAGDPTLVEAVEKSRGPYKVSAAAERAALAALRTDLPWVRERAAEAVAARGRLEAGLTGLGLAPLPSSANFVLVPVPDAPAVAARMRSRGVAVRAFGELRGIGGALRITAAPQPELDRCLAALAEALA